MHNLVIYVAVFILSLTGCSSFTSKENSMRGGGGADQKIENRDPFDTGAKGGAIDAHDDDENGKSIEITANGQKGVLTVDGATPVTLDWTAVGYTDCDLKGTSKSGLSGSHDLGVVTADTTHTLVCTEGDDTKEKSISIKIEPTDFNGPNVEVFAKKSGGTYQSGELVVDYGTDVVVKVQSATNAGTQIYACSLQPLGAPISPNTTKEIEVTNLTQTTIFSFQCEDVDSVVNTATVKVIVNPPPAIAGWIKVNNVLNSTIVERNETVTVSWHAQHADECKVSKRDSDPLEILSSGVPGTSAKTFSYTIDDMTILDLDCKGVGGRVFQSSIAIHIDDEIKGRVDLKARVKGSATYLDGPVIADYNDDIELKWTSCVLQSNGDCLNDADSICKVVTPYHGEFPAAGTSDSSKGLVTLKDVKQSQSLLLFCSMPVGAIVQDFITIQVGAAPIPEASIKANGKEKPTNPSEVYTVTVNYEDDVALDWTSKRADHCAIEPLGFNSKQGHVVVRRFTQTMVVSLTCKGAGGTTKDFVVIKVAGGPPDTGDCQTESCWSKEVSKACQGAGRKSKAFTVVVPRVGPCQFDSNGNLGPFIGDAYLRLRAAEQSDVALNAIPTGSALCSADIKLAKPTGSSTRSKLFYNDQMFQLLSGAVLSTTIEDFTHNLDREVGFFAFSKSKIIGDQGYNVDGVGVFPHYCAAADAIIVPGASASDKGACVAPTFNITKEANLGEFSQVISDSLGVKLSTYKIVKFGKDEPYVYSLGAFGDQDSFDCSVGSNYSGSKDIHLEFNVEYAPLLDADD